MRENSKSRDVNGLDGGTQWAEDGNSRGPDGAIMTRMCSPGRWPFSYTGCHIQKPTGENIGHIMADVFTCCEIGKKWRKFALRNTRFFFLRNSGLRFGQKVS